VKHAYYKALELEEALKVIQATETLYQEIERTTNEYRQRKMVLPADAIEVKQQLANTSYEGLKLKNALDSQKEALNHMIGRNLQSPLNLTAPGEAPDADIDLNGAILRAKQNRAELRQAQMQAAQVDLERKIKKLQYLPELSIGFDYLSVFGTQVLPQNLLLAGFFVNWEPIDWGRRHAEIAEQRKIWRQANNSMHETETQITMEVNSAYRSLQEGKQFLQVAQLGRQLALERLRVATNKYNAQAALLKDVLQSQRDLTQANNQYTQAVLSLWRARADFQKAVGEQ
jgi:outer membrane protein TolC